MHVLTGDAWNPLIQLGTISIIFGVYWRRIAINTSIYIRLIIGIQVMWFDSGL